MTKRTLSKRAALGTTVAALATGLAALAAPAPSIAQDSPAGTYKPSSQVLLSVGEGQLINLPRAVADVWTSNPGVADVNVSSPRQIGLFGKEGGEATVIATAADGSVVWGANVRVSQNISSVNEMLRATMPESNISVTHVGQLAVINGTVASPADSAEAEQLVRAMLNPGVDTSAPGAVLKIVPVNRLRTATPLQVMLQVKIAEVSRSVLQNIGVNLLTQDTTGGFRFGVGQGEGIDTETGAVLRAAIGTTLQARGNLLGLDIIGALNLAETNGLVTTLAEPNLVALSGETASFLAGGEFPIPSSEGINGTSIEFKEYGVSLAFSPTVLEGGRISMRVRPEVSEISNENAVRLNGFLVPALTTRRAETTVELGSGQSFMIAGLLNNTGNNSVDKAPFLGDLPILGALFRSNSFRRNQTELVIVVTPYLVKPVNASQIALPTDGFRTGNNPQRLLLNKSEDSRSREARPMPRMAPPQGATPAVNTGGVVQAPPARPAAQGASAAKPGFGF